jgi:predicted DNA-binding transcriptional regulator
MIRGAGKLLKAESEEDVLSRPVVVTNYIRILELLKKEKEGLTNHEICKKLDFQERRRVSENIQVMKDRGIVGENTCRCGNTPIYYIL